jgi:hypothetical protein
MKKLNILILTMIALGFVLTFGAPRSWAQGVDNNAVYRARRTAFVGVAVSRAPADAIVCNQSVAISRPGLPMEIATSSIRQWPQIGQRLHAHSR